MAPTSPAAGHGMVTFVDLFSAAAAWVDTLFRSTRPEQLDRPTPCDQWTVRDLMSHLVASNRLFVAAATGGRAPSSRENQLGEDPAAAYAASVAAVRVAFSEPGALERTMQLRLGPPMTGAAVMALGFADGIIHGWDLAKATGQDTTIDPDLLAAADVVWHQAPVDMLRQGGQLGPEIKVSSRATPQRQLLAFLGRGP